jgi:hypothetical protein
MYFNYGAGGRGGGVEAEAGTDRRFGKISNY